MVKEGGGGLLEKEIDGDSYRGLECLKSGKVKGYEGCNGKGRWK